jgi:hypothetical protein
MLSVQGFLRRDGLMRRQDAKHVHCCDSASVSQRVEATCFLISMDSFSDDSCIPECINVDS